MLDHAPIEHHYTINNKTYTINQMEIDILQYSKKLEADFFKSTEENEKIFIAGMLNAYNDILYRISFIK